MKLKCSFEIIDMGGELIAVPVGEKARLVHGVVKLNSAGKEIFELLKRETNEKEIVDYLTMKFENDRSVLEEYVKSVIVSLTNADLLE